MKEFEERIATLSSEMPKNARDMARHVLDLELRNRFTDRSQLPANFADKALKAASTSPDEESRS